MTKLCLVRVRAMVLTETVSWWRWARCQAIVSGPASKPDSVSCLRSLTIRSTVACGTAVGLFFGRRERGSKAVWPSVR
ncbi:hypothetical protein ACVW00_000815 [Marmoricola sp. URHA0025 HA25]